MGQDEPEVVNVAGRPSPLNVGPSDDAPVREPKTEISCHVDRTTMTVHVSCNKEMFVLTPQGLAGFLTKVLRDVYREPKPKPSGLVDLNGNPL
jgi:hypothetical protein